MHNFPLRQNPQEELLLALAGYAAYAEKMARFRPKKTENAGYVPEFAMIAEMLESGEVRLQRDWIAYRRVKEVSTRMPRAIAAQLRHRYETRISPCKKPDMEVCRTPGQPARKIVLPFIFNGERQQTDAFNQDDSVETNRMVQQHMELGNYRGWMLHNLFVDENAWNGRWRYWDETQTYGKLLKAPIPQINWEPEPHPDAIRNLHHNLDTISPTWRTSVEEKRRTIEYFFDWLLWSLGHSLQPKFPTDLWDGRTHDKLYQTFVPCWYLMAPHDYFGWLLNEHAADLGVPIQISMQQAIAVAENLFPGAWTKQSTGKGGFGKGKAQRDYRSEVVVDPETGSARVMLTASNFSLVQIGYSTHPLLSKAALINAYIFVPWAIYPFPFLFANKSPDLLSLLGRTLKISKAKGLDRNYFAQTEPHPEWQKFEPIQQRRIRANVTVKKPRQVVTPNIQVKPARIAITPNITIGTSIAGEQDRKVLNPSIQITPQKPALPSAEQ